MLSKPSWTMTACQPGGVKTSTRPRLLKTTSGAARQTGGTCRIALVGRMNAAKRRPGTAIAMAIAHSAT